MSLLRHKLQPCFMASNHECSGIKGILKCAIDVVTFTASKLFRKKYIPNQVQIHEELK